MPRPLSPWGSGLQISCHAKSGVSAARSLTNVGRQNAKTEILLRTIFATRIIQKEMVTILLQSVQVNRDGGTKLVLVLLYI